MRIRPIGHVGVLRALWGAGTAPLVLGLVACEASAPSAYEYVETLSGPLKVDIVADPGADPDQRKEAILSLRVQVAHASEDGDFDAEALSVLEAVVSRLLVHEQCDVRLDGWAVLSLFASADLSERNIADEGGRRRLIEALRKAGVEAGRFIVRQDACTDDGRVRFQSNLGCWVDHRVWDDSLTFIHDHSNRACLQLDVAYHLALLKTELNDDQLVDPLVHLALAAEDAVVRGLVLSLLDRQILPRGRGLIEMTARRLRHDPDPHVRERAFELLDPAIRLVDAIRVDLGETVEGRVQEGRARAPGGPGGNPIFQLVLEEQTDVVVDLAGLADLNPALWILNEDGRVLARDDDSGTDGAARLVITLEAGTHYVYPFGSAGSPGRFRLTTTQR